MNYLKNKIFNVSEGIDINKSSKSKDCDICYYSYFLSKGFNFQSHVYNRCHDLLMNDVYEP